ncbi:MAG: hypothetical protein M3295_03435 [Chloroflexota bacterium]|nr:hypothetical protein [Chloroflexota bacterium]
MQLAIASAAAVAILAVGGILMTPKGGVGGPGLDTATPAPTPVLLTEQDISAVLDAGTYAIDAPFPIRITLTTPNAWTMWALSADVTGVDQAPGTGAAGLGFWIADNVFVDPCRPQLGEVSPPVGPSVDELASALENLPFYTVTPATDVTLAGLPGKQLEITAPAGVRGCVAATFAWSTPTGDRKFLTAGEHAVITILDVDGTRLVVYAVDFPGASDADLAALEAVVQSISFDLP